MSSCQHLQRCCGFCENVEDATCKHSSTCDEYMRTEILNKLNSGRTRYVSDVIRSVEEIPEFRNASTKIKLVHGNVRNETGRWILVVAAGTNGGYPIAKLYYEYGISTVIYLQIDHKDAKKIHDEKLKGNLVVLGHLAGDSIGLNALADKAGNIRCGNSETRIGSPSHLK